ncbi:hypothetical protein L596_002928 [Steinernema carpocapsae]|uniref:F-actin monooxygenase n=1 Tax=Steinernema carpocapsae TaxID=34508 RepID=A0A4U8UUS8_STECR|nr:hypothetical protein L596_002928 [Steinernema carpocapsae]
MAPPILFDIFAQATTFRQIQQYFNQICLVHDIDPTDYRNLYAKLRTVDEDRKNSKAQKLFSLLDKKFTHPVYVGQKAADKFDVLIVGAGPCGLRAAIECTLLGAQVVVLEQRDKFTRNNVLHLWPFVIQDLKSLGAKIFYPKFCTGSIDHISIRQLQCILLKVALCLGVQVHDSVSFIDYKKPVVKSDGSVGGWTAQLEPHTHILSNYEFDVLIGADGKRNTVKGFPKDCLRARLAIGITANFINTHDSAEAQVQEISGVAFIFNQPFFNEMKAQTGVELENIVYYKDDTHYFVMSAMKRSLLAKHVLKQDYDEVSLLLSKDNIDQEMLCKFAAQAADFATNNQLPLNYVTNGRGECDVAMFDFTAVYKAQHSVTLSESSGRFLLTTIVGDSLFEPFWPTGSGCARGFLGVFDSAWMIRELGLRRRSAIEVIAERESIYTLLANANKDNMQNTYSQYTIDPKTRYKSQELCSTNDKVSCHLDFENREALGDGDCLKVRNTAPSYYSTSPIIEMLRLWRVCNGVLGPKFRVVNFSAQSWGDGYALAALLGRFRKDLVDFSKFRKEIDSAEMLKAVFTAVESEYGLEAPCADVLSWANLDDEERYHFVRALLNYLMGDRESVRVTFSNVPRSALNGHRKKVKVNTSSARKAEPIKRVAALLTSNFVASDPSVPKRTNLERKLSFSSQEEIQNSHAESSRKKYDFTTESNDKPYTKRPQVDRLDPVKLCRVEQIISGRLEKDQSEQFHNSRFVSSVAKTRRMDRSDLEEMEQKLEKTAMGTLIDREKFHSMSSKEEKMMRVNAADARNFAHGGFKDPSEKFREIDSRLEKAEKILKNKALSGVNIVSQIKGVPSTKKGPPPPVPSKSAKSNGVEVVLRSNATDYAPRPVSMPVVSDSSYSSVNGRRKQPCAICSDEVYLAEQLLVEKKIIHKRCFRCAYCEQPLRLGNYGTDRAITDAYGIRFYCSQHGMMSFREKVARLEKQSKRSNRASVAIVQPLSVPSGSSVSYNSTTSSEAITSNAAFTRTAEKFSLRNINSPDAYKQRTIERIQAIADNPKLSLQSTPERAQYQCARQEDDIASNRSINEGFLMDSDDGDEEEEVIRDDDSTADEDEESGHSSQEEADSDNVDPVSDDDDDFADCEEWLQDSLGDHLRAYFGENPNDEVTLRDAEGVLNLYNRTLNEDSLEMETPCTPEGTRLSNNSVYFTTRSKFASPDEDSGEDVESKRGYDLVDNVLSGLRAEFSPYYRNIESPSTASSRLNNSDDLTADLTIPIESTPTRPCASRSNHVDFRKNMALATLADDESRISTGKDVSVPFADDSPNDSVSESPQVRRRSVGSLIARLPEFMKKRRSQSRGSSSVTVVPVDPDHLEDTLAGMSELAIDGPCSERKEETISPGATTCISILPKNHKCEASSPSSSGRTGFKCSICDSLGTKVSVPVAKTKTPLSATPKNIQRVRDEMEKYRSNMEHELTLHAQEIQRKISETERRLQDVIVTGSDLEYRLKNNTGNCWTLERWVEYLQEYKMLNLKLEELHIRVKEMRLAREFGEIQRQMDSIRTSSLGVMPVGINEARTRQNATRIITVLDERKAFHEERRLINKKWEAAKCSIASVISETVSDFSKFKPIFSDLKLKIDQQL